MQKSCICDFLHGPLTGSLGILQIKDALQGTEEKQVEILYYKKEGKTQGKNLCCKKKMGVGGGSTFLINWKIKFPIMACSKNILLTFLCINILKFFVCLNFKEV
jgi:hypothetical protein